MVILGAIKAYLSSFPEVSPKNLLKNLFYSGDPLLRSRPRPAWKRRGGRTTEVWLIAGMLLLVLDSLLPALLSDGGQRQRRY